VADAGGRPVAVRETDKLEGEFASLQAVAAVVDRMESWSRLVFEAMPFDRDDQTVTARESRGL